MSNKINDLQFYTNSSILLLGITLTFIILIIFFPVFAGNYYYEIGTILIYSGPSDKIPKNFALCDGTNNTPDLTGKFIIGAYTDDDIPIVESMNTDITYTNSIDPRITSRYIGPGLRTSTDQSTVSNDTTVIPQAFAKGNIPYIFGTVYTSEVKTIDNTNIGATFFKDYSLINDNNSDNICHTLHTQTDTQTENFTNLPRLYSNIKTLDSDKVDICNSDQTLLTDANMGIKQLDMIDTGETDAIDYRWYLNKDTSDLEEVAEKEIINQDDGNGNSYSVKHVPQYRNLFRDYEDYVLYLNGNKSHYNSLPVNLKFTDHSYNYNFSNYIKTPKEDGYIINIPEYMNNFTYEQPYSNNPSYLKLAYIMRIK